MQKNVTFTKWRKVADKKPNGGWRAEFEQNFQQKITVWFLSATFWNHFATSAAWSKEMESSFETPLEPIVTP